MKSAILAMETSTPQYFSDPRTRKFGSGQLLAKSYSTPLPPTPNVHNHRWYEEFYTIINSSFTLREANWHTHPFADSGAQAELSADQQLHFPVGFIKVIELYNYSTVLSCPSLPSNMTTILLTNINENPWFY